MPEKLDFKMPNPFCSSNVYGLTTLNTPKERILILGLLGTKLRCAHGLFSWIYNENIRAWLGSYSNPQKLTLESSTGPLTLLSCDKILFLRPSHP